MNQSAGVRLYAVSTSENARDRDHRAQRGEDEVEVVAEKDSVEPSRIGRHQALFYACSRAMTQELDQQVPKDDHRHVGQEPALQPGGTSHPVEATVFFSSILALDIDGGKTIAVHIRESTLT